MGLTSTAESKLDARIRPEITLLRSRTSYPKRHRPLGAVPDQAPADAVPLQPETTTGAPVSSPADLAQPALDSLVAEESSVQRPATEGPAAVRSAGAGPVSAVPARTLQGVAGRPRASQPAASRRPVPEGPIRLTRRGRIVVGAFVVIVVAAAVSLVWLLVASQAQASSHVQSGQAASHALKRVVVRPGQTLWSIAASADPAADPRVVIQEIIDENSLGGTAIQPGQVLWVPRS
ncbi:MAG TPA: LysM peptidoglycan-binding domain-containing protein [Streptosporangiaceae bacterium]